MNGWGTEQAPKTRGIGSAEGAASDHVERRLHGSLERDALCLA
jgi:hypothetical protein